MKRRVELSDYVVLYADGAGVQLSDLDSGASFFLSEKEGKTLAIELAAWAEWIKNV